MYKYVKKKILIYNIYIIIFDILLYVYLYVIITDRYFIELYIL